MIKHIVKLIIKLSFLTRFKFLIKYFVLFVLSLLIITNIWWLFDCQICFGHTCGHSVCEDHNHYKCVNQCYKENKINDQNITLKIKEKNNTSISSVKYDSDLIWQILHEYGIRVYSAFKTQNSVLLIAQVNDHLVDYIKDKFKCVFSHEKKIEILPESEAGFEIFDEGGFNVYRSARITCHSYSNPKYVKLVLKYDENIQTNYTTINYNSAEDRSGNEIVAVCHQPLFGPYDSIRDILEFIAYYKVNGINKIVFYDHFVSKQVLQLLKSMPEFVEIIPWRTSDHFFNRNPDQLTLLDDCLHRFRNKIILLMDIDEYFISFSHKTLKEFIVNERKDSSIAALSLRNVFLCCEYNLNTQKKFPKVLNQFNKQLNVWPKEFRSKMIVLRPELVDRMETHHVYRLSANYSSTVKYVDKSDALMFHYRSCCTIRRTPVFNGLISFPILNESVIRDQSMAKFSEEMIKFIENYIYL